MDDPRSPESGPGGGPGWPEFLLGVGVAWCLWTLRPELTLHWRANDSAIHASLVRWVAERLADGHLPLDGWYPYLSLGAARFHHYQSLPHLLTGTLEWATGSRWVFPLSSYLLLATWPISVYIGGRLLETGRVAAAGAGVIAPLVASTQRMGIQWETFSWSGYGAWAQLWGMWMLPIALGLTWQAVARGRHRGRAAAAIGVIFPTHLIVSYLVVFCTAAWTLLGTDRALRLRRALLIGLAGALAAAWFLVPLVSERAWMTRELLASDIGYRSFGIERVLRAFANGQTLDARRPALLTMLSLAGGAIAMVRCRRDEPARSVLTLTAVGLVLYSGRATFGFILDHVPGMQDVFMPRFILGFQLGLVYLAGIALAALVAWILPDPGGWVRRTSAALSVAAIAVALLPSVLERGSAMSRQERGIRQQATAEATDAADLRSLLDLAEGRGGRVYAGLREGDGRGSRIGFTPLYMALLNEDVDAIGLTRPTWSILSNIESQFDEDDAGHYLLFGVRYVITPSGISPGVAGTLVSSRPCCDLWEIETTGYLRLAQSRRTTTAERLTLLGRARSFLASEEFAEGGVWTIGYGGASPAVPLLDHDEPITLPAELGKVLEQVVDLADGRVAATVEIRGESLLVLAATFDPGWSAEIDGAPAEVQMVSPGMVAVALTEGRHDVRFTWRGFPYYGLLALGWLAPVLVARRRWVGFSGESQLAAR